MAENGLLELFLRMHRWQNFNKFPKILSQNSIKITYFTR